MKSHLPVLLPMLLVLSLMTMMCLGGNGVRSLHLAPSVGINC